MKKLGVVAFAAALLWACEDGPELINYPDEPEVEVEAPAEAPVLGNEPEVASISKATYLVSLWADAPSELDPGGPETVVLKYENFPGHYEVFAADAVKDCVLAYEKAPFEMTVYRYQAVNDGSYERVVALAACPDLDESKLAAQWLDAELMRQGFDDPNAAAPGRDLMGWAGRGFYRVEGADPNASPKNDEWETFCGDKTEVACKAALRTGTGDR